MAALVYILQRYFEDKQVAALYVVLFQKINLVYIGGS